MVRARGIMVPFQIYPKTLDPFLKMNLELYLGSFRREEPCLIAKQKIR